MFPKNHGADDFCGGGDTEGGQQEFLLKFLKFLKFPSRAAFPAWTLLDKQEFPGSVVSAGKFTIWG